MIRRIIQINSEKCNGCALCVNACHEDAIGLIDGKAVLLRDDYCDGLGDCLPTCPTNAISFIEREALEYDADAVKKNIEAKKKLTQSSPYGCPGTAAKTIKRDEQKKEVTTTANISSQLNQWPVQLNLANPRAAWLDNANLLISADCAAYAFGNFHNEFMKDKVTLIGCPKLDEGDYSDKLTDILVNNNIKSVTVVRMEVPCCSGIANAAITALKNCGKMIPWSVITISTDGEILK